MMSPRKRGKEEKRCGVEAEGIAFSMQLNILQLRWLLSFSIGSLGLRGSRDTMSASALRIYAYDLSY